MKTLRFVITNFALLVGVAACAGAPIPIPDAMPKDANLQAPHVVSVAKKLDAEIVDESWHDAAISWPRLDRGMFYWTTTIKNDAPESRDICVVFDLLSSRHRVLLEERGCRVVASGKEGHFSSNAFVNLDLLKRAASGQAHPFESHNIYYPKATTG
jgi:hypothetical protein